MDADKAKELEKLLQSNPIDLWRLRELAISAGGLLNDDIRRRAWPQLVGLYTTAQQHKLDEHLQLNYGPAAVDVDDNETVATEQTSRASNAINKKTIARCLDYKQIDLDVFRCTWHLLTGSQRTQQLQMEHRKEKSVARIIQKKQRKLANLINLTLCRSSQNENSSQHGHLRYYQGYHDVACIVLSVFPGPLSTAPANHTNVSLEHIHRLGLDVPSHVLMHLSHSHLRDCLQNNFIHLQIALRLTMFPLVALIDHPIHTHLQSVDMEPFFCLSWVITWFAHEIRDTRLVQRLFDLFLASHPLLPIYVSVAMVLHPYNRQEVLETEKDFAPLHQALANLPKNSSMVGWKYQPGDGYVSDQEGDEDTLSTENDQPDLVDVAVIQHAGLERRSTDANTSVSSLEDVHARVPFEEIIDLAIQYMDRVPPHRLLHLARRYYGPDHVEQFLQQAPGISLFEKPPQWSRAPVPFASGREDMLDGDQQRIVLDSREQVIQREIAARGHSPAIIAAGFGTGYLKELQRKKRRRKIRAIVIAVTVVLLAVGAQRLWQARVEALARAETEEAARIAAEKEAQRIAREAMLESQHLEEARSRAKQEAQQRLAAEAAEKARLRAEEEDRLRTEEEERNHAKEAKRARLQAEKQARQRAEPVCLLAEEQDQHCAAESAGLQTEDVERKRTQEEKSGLEFEEEARQRVEVVRLHIEDGERPATQEAGSEAKNEEVTEQSADETIIVQSCDDVPAPEENDAEVQQEEADVVIEDGVHVHSPAASEETQLEIADKTVVLQGDGTSEVQSKPNVDQEAEGTAEGTTTAVDVVGVANLPRTRTAFAGDISRGIQTRLSSISRKVLDKVSVDENHLVQLFRNGTALKAFARLSGSKQQRTSDELGKLRDTLESLGVSGAVSHCVVGIGRRVDHGAQSAVHRLRADGPHASQILRDGTKSAFDKVNSGFEFAKQRVNALYEDTVGNDVRLRTPPEWSKLSIAAQYRAVDKLQDILVSDALLKNADAFVSQAKLVWRAFEMKLAGLLSNIGKRLQQVDGPFKTLFSVPPIAIRIQKAFQESFDASSGEETPLMQIVGGGLWKMFVELGNQSSI